MTSLLLLWTYLCVAVFAVAAGARVFKYRSLPTHLRWELYPVMHEAGKKAEYGGSYLEESDWWTKKRESSLYNEMKFMVPEILFIRALWEENRKLWFVSFPFHFGLYLLIGAFGLLLISGIALAAGVPIGPQAGGIGMLLYYLTLICGFAGLILGAFGAAGLLLRRIADPDLRSFTTLSDYFNLLLFLGFLAVALITGLIADPTLEGARQFFLALVTFGPVDLSALGAVTAFLAAFVAAYIPLTHMSHMFMKYFMYHDIRWGDEPNLRGSKLEKQIMKNLGYKPTWSAPHIKGDGSKTWADLAMSTGLEEDK